MLINLRSRRRPRYVAYICTFVSALLLLLSVSFLYTRLSHSHPHPPPPDRLCHCHRNSRPLHHEFNYESLLSDSVNDETSGSEDKIDALDNIEEQQEEDYLRSMDVEEEDEPFDQIKVSGYYFDHVSGVIRRAFDQRSIEEWDDSQLGLFMGSEIVEDFSKAAFGSDDVQMDDLVRRKAIRVLGIEDALLLKMGRRVSPLREGWGDWFDKKADFLRKDKMLRSNLEALNPLNNPMLQDPDGVGVTGLTRGDRIVQKSLLDDFKRVPFLGKETRESKLEFDHIEAKVQKCNSETDSKGKRCRCSDIDHCREESNFP